MYIEEGLCDKDEIHEKANDNSLLLESIEDDDGDIEEGQKAEPGNNFEVVRSLCRIS